MRKILFAAVLALAPVSALADNGLINGLMPEYSKVIVPLLMNAPEVKALVSAQTSAGHQCKPPVFKVNDTPNYFTGFTATIDCEWFDSVETHRIQITERITIKSWFNGENPDSSKLNFERITVDVNPPQQQHDGPPKKKAVSVEKNDCYYMVNGKCVDSQAYGKHIADETKGDPDLRENKPFEAVARLYVFNGTAFLATSQHEHYPVTFDDLSSEQVEYLTAHCDQALPCAAHWQIRAVVGGKDHQRLYYYKLMSWR